MNSEIRGAGRVEPMPTDNQFKTMNLIHGALMNLTFGKIGWKAGGMPVLKVTTTGRKSGKPRQTILTSPLSQGDAIVIVASKGGAEDHPDWYLNMMAKPEVEVEKNGKTTAMIATVATDEQKTAMWPEIVAAYKGYGSYQRKTERNIPVLLLKPKA